MTLARIQGHESEHPLGEFWHHKEVGNSGTTRKTKDSGRKDTVAVPELQRIQELHKYF